MSHCEQPIGWRSWIRLEVVAWLEQHLSSQLSVLDQKAVSGWIPYILKVAHATFARKNKDRVRA